MPEPSIPISGYRYCCDCNSVYQGSGRHLSCARPGANNYISWATNPMGPVEFFPPDLQDSNATQATPNVVTITPEESISSMPAKAKVKPAEGVTIIAKSSPSDLAQGFKPSIRTSISTQGYVHSIKAPVMEAVHEIFKSSNNEDSYGLIDGITVSPSLAKSFPKLLPRETAIQQHADLLHAMGIARRNSVPDLTLPGYDSTVTPAAYRTIKAVGFEIEGCWRGREGEDGPDGLDFHVVGDGSVHAETNNMRTLGEVRMGPYPNGVIDEEQVRHQYPDHVNASCGLHVHLSFPTMGIYNTFMSKEFYNWFIDGLKTWRTKAEANGAPRSQTFWSRIMGENRQYCPVMYNPDGCSGQVVSRASRYNAINYCLSKHGTIEVRVLNAWNTADECLLAVREVMRLFALWSSQFTFPLDTLSYGEEASQLSLATDDLPAMLMPSGPLLLHPGYRVSNAMISSKSAGCATCQGSGYRRLACGCHEWCSACQPKRYATQFIKHDLKRCWAKKGLNWNKQNLLCGVPQAYAPYEGLLRTGNTTPCPICGQSRMDGHLGRPSASCLMGMSENLLSGYHLILNR